MRRRLTMDEERPFVLDEEEVRRRAEEISLRPGAGSAEENRLQAVDELRRERTAAWNDTRPEPEARSPFPPNTAPLTHP
jgi:hypothetical protein